MAQPNELMVITRMVQFALKALSDRLLTWVTMAITAGLFGWVMLAPDWTRLAGASIFALLVFWRVTKIEKPQEQPQGE